MQEKELIDRSLFFLSHSFDSYEQKISAIEELRTLLIEHNRLYYQQAAPCISDVDYDTLFLLLKQREEQYPELIVQNSPTQALVGQKLEWFVSSAHLATMGSLQNTYSPQDIQKRDEGLRRIQIKEWYNDWSFVIEPKFDGMAVEIVYEFGVFVRAVTRGDGEKGEDITAHAYWLWWLPKSIDIFRSIETVALRGEIVMPKEAFTRLEWIRTTSWSSFANPRNATAWTLRQLDTSLVATRWLEIRVYDLLYSSSALVRITNAREWFDFLDMQWFTVSSMLYYCSSINEVIAFCESEQTKQQAMKQSIDLDWLVVKINEFSMRWLFGATNHHPKRAIAYKFPAQQVATQLRDVSFQVGRSGILTPVAQLDPVQLSGVIIQKASLHNWLFIQERDLMLDDRVLLQRSGEVIPYIVACIPERRTWTERQILQPTQCPVCQHTVSYDIVAGGLRCMNSSCSAQLKQRLEYFVSKNCLDISGLWPRMIALCVDAWLLQDVADIFLLPTKKQQLRTIPGIAEKKIIQLEQEIQKARTVSLDRILTWLSIRHIGSVIAQDIIAHYMQHTPIQKRNYSDFIQTMLDELLLVNINWIWPQIIASLKDFFSDISNVTLFHRLDTLWVLRRWDDVNILASDALRVVITGSFVLPRVVIERVLREYGIKVQSSLSAQTSYLIVGDNPGSKYQEAQRLWIASLSREAFLASQWIVLDSTMFGWNEIIQQHSLF